MIFPCCCKPAGWRGDPLGFYGSVSTLLCPAARGLPRRSSNTLAGAIVEINASVTLSGLLAPPFVIVRKVVTEGD